MRPQSGRSPLPKFAALGKLTIAAVVVFALALSGCATTKTADSDAEQSDSAARKTEAPPPGTERWDELAAQLPANSPLVLSVRADRLFANADSLREWLFEEPAMFGENGAAVVSRWKQRWRSLVARTGGNPLDPEMLQSLAVDTSRPLRVGLYPVTGGGQSDYVEAVERVIRQKFQLTEGDTLLKRLQKTQAVRTDYPSGLYDAAEQATSDIHPNLGGRAVIPTKDAGEFVEHVRQLATLSGYAPFDSIDISSGDSEANGGGESAPSPVGFYRTGSRWPGLVIRPKENIAIVDILYRPFDPPRSSSIDAPERIKKALSRAVESYRSGRPDAPAADGINIASISADQDGTARFIRLLGYLEAIGAVGTTAAERRDKLFTGGILSSLMTGRKWAAASERLTGITYSLTGTLGSAHRMARLNMTMYGVPPAKELPYSPSQISLGVKNRSIAASLDLKPLFDERWQEWLAVDNPADLLEVGDAAGTRPFFSVLAVPRNAALAFVNADHIPREEFPAELQALHEHRRLLGRLEIATSGIDVRTLRSEPRVATLLTLDGTADSKARHAVLQALTPVLNDLAQRRPASVSSETDGQKAKPGPTAAGPAVESVAEDSLIELPASNGGPSVRYFATARKEGPFFLMTYGLTGEQATGELNRARQDVPPESNNHIAYARLEPAALFALVAAVDDRPTEPFDTGIVAQRLGALTFNAESNRYDSYQTLEYSLTLHAPPEL